MRIWNITLTWSLKKRVKGSVLKFTILQLNPTRPTGVFLRGILKVEFHFIRLIWDKVEVLCLFPPCYVLLLAFTYKSQFRDSSKFFCSFFCWRQLFLFLFNPFLVKTIHKYLHKPFSRLEPRLCTWRLFDRYEKQEEERKSRFSFRYRFRKKCSISLNRQ